MKCRKYISNRLTPKKLDNKKEMCLDSHLYLTTALYWIFDTIVLLLCVHAL